MKLAYEYSYWVSSSAPSVGSGIGSWWGPKVACYQEHIRYHLTNTKPWKDCLEIEYARASRVFQQEIQMLLNQFWRRYQPAISTLPNVWSSVPVINPAAFHNYLPKGNFKKAHHGKKCEDSQHQQGNDDFDPVASSNKARNCVAQKLVTEIITVRDEN